MTSSPSTSTPITTASELEAVIGSPERAVAEKVRTVLDPIDRVWLDHSPLVLIGTSDAGGRLDVSPKGDPAGQLVHVIDDRTMAIAERPGNRRADGYHNILANPHVGLLFLVPGRGDTLRINGRATLLADAPYFDELIVKGHRPVLAIEVAIEEVYFHCAKAFMRSKAWQPDTWEHSAIPSVARISKALVRKDTPVEELERYYEGPGYAAKLYGN